ncbi:MAG: lactate racemase domain-containing protein, partial [Candidatus Sumerlaeota bacterium]
GTCAIVVDPEHPAVCRQLLTPLLDLIHDESDIAKENFTIIVAHRPLSSVTPDDLNNLFDESILQGYRVVVHDPTDIGNIITIGESSKKVPLTISKIYQEAEAKILLGGVAPDLLSGFTGGRALLMPGLCGKETLKAMYDFNFVADRQTRFGNFRDNAFHIVGIETVGAAGCDIAVSAVMTQESEIHKVFAGHYGASHLQAMSTAREAMLVRVKEPMDIVVTSGGGNPLDGTLAQVVNALCAVEHVLKPEGTIVISAALEQGLGPDGFADIVRSNRGVHKTLERLSLSKKYTPGQWIAQRFYQLLTDHEIILFNKDMEEGLIWDIGLTPTNDMNEAIMGAMQSHGQRCKIVALPEGPRGIGEIGSATR